MYVMHMYAFVCIYMCAYMYRHVCVYLCVYVCVFLCILYGSWSSLHNENENNYKIKK